ncbi:hypothetical protein V6N13_034990 [Hibiscus sabdariffa]
MRGGASAHGKTFADATMNRTRSKHSAVDGQTLPKRRPQTKDGQAPVPRGLSLGVVSTPYCRAAKLTLVH